MQKDKSKQKVQNCWFSLVWALYLLFCFDYIRGLKSFIRPVDKLLAETLKDGQKKISRVLNLSKSNWIVVYEFTGKSTTGNAYNFHKRKITFWHGHKFTNLDIHIMPYRVRFGFQLQQQSYCVFKLQKTLQAISQEQTNQETNTLKNKVTCIKQQKTSWKSSKKISWWLLISYSSLIPIEKNMQGQI